MGKKIFKVIIACSSPKSLSHSGKNGEMSNFLARILLDLWIIGSRNVFMNFLGQHLAWQSFKGHSFPGN